MSTAHPKPTPVWEGHSVPRCFPQMWEGHSVPRCFPEFRRTECASHIEERFRASNTEGGYCESQTHSPIATDAHSEHLREFRRMAGGGTFLVTKCLQPRKPVLIDEVASVVAETICYQARNDRMLLAAFIVMPDHWHAVIGILPDDSLAKRMGAISKWASQNIRKLPSAAAIQWQDGYHDTRIRSAKQFDYAVNYVRTNPVRAGLVTDAADWQWSSLKERYTDAITASWPWRFEYDI